MNNAKKKFVIKQIQIQIFLIVKIDQELSFIELIEPLWKNSRQKVKELFSINLVQQKPNMNAFISS